MEITKTIRAHAVVTEVSTYEVQDDKVTQLTQTGLSLEEAFGILAGNGSVEQLSCGVEDYDITEEHEESVEES